MMRFSQSGAVRWLALAIAASASIAILGAGMTWSAAPRVDRSQASLNLAHLDGGALPASPVSPHGVVDFTPDGTQPGLQAAMESPETCFSCHRSFNPGDTSSEFMPHNTWGGSMMSHAARDPLFWAALDVANQDVPGVGDYCLRCHTPNGWLGGRVSKTGDGGIVDGANGCLLEGDHDNRDNKDNDYSGLTCHFCHRMDEVGPAGQVAPLENGNFWVDDSLGCETPDGNSYFGPCRKGPYAYVQDDPLMPPHGWEYSRFLDRGSVCGTCHDVSTPTTSEGPLETLILEDGTDSGIPMPVERTFSEWQDSDFADVIFRNRMGDDFDFTPQLAKGATCQDCHMAASEDPIARACSNNPEGSRTGNLPVHEFVGANTWVPLIIRDEYALNIASGSNDRINDIDQTILRARNMLTERSATIETTVVSSGTDEITAAVRITNLAGHKLPTGYAEGRRMWIHVVARDVGGTVLWENGAWNPATGALVQDDQTKIYETLQGIWNTTTQTCDIEDGLGRKQFHFVLNNCIAKDNRIPPLGFTGGADLEMRPVAYSYPPTSPGSSRLVNFDETVYTIPLPTGTTGAVDVTATLKFQIASDDYITFLRDQAVEGAFEPENTMCSTGPNRPFTVGPQNQTRGEYMFDLWSDPAYGRSPPEDMVSATGSISVAANP
jgi:hypothetical protein